MCLHNTARIVACYTVSVYDRWDTLTQTEDYGISADFEELALSQW